MSQLDKIRELCEKKGISMRKLESDLHFSNGSIRKSEKHSMASDRVKSIADYFGVPVEYLLEEGGEEKEGYYFNEDAKEYAQFLFDNPEYRILFDAARDVDVKDLQKAITMLGLFKKEDE